MGIINEYSLFFLCVIFFFVLLCFVFLDKNLLIFCMIKLGRRFSIFVCFLILWVYSRIIRIESFVKIIKKN